MSAYLAGLTGANFDYHEYLAQFSPAVLSDPRGRRALTKLDPLLFALLYFAEHLRSGEAHDGPITLADFHIDMARRSLLWSVKGVEQRAAEVAPRGSGKSTWNFLIRPMWALAHRHRYFVAAFADSGPQAEQHLLSFKRELDSNELLRLDHPGLCTPMRRNSGTTVADSKNLYVSMNNQVFMAKGIDSSVLGAKVGNQRPDLILFDDIEPSGSLYTDYQKDKRARTMIDSVLPMNLSAAVIISGTVVMPGSIVHDLVRTVTDPDGDWRETLKSPRPNITEQRFATHYYPAMFDDDEGVTQSVWPQKWSVEWMQSPVDPNRPDGKKICETDTFLLNWMNDPRGNSGGWWEQSDIQYGCIHSSKGILQIDPAVTTKTTSDYTGLAVLTYRPRGKESLSQVEVKYARQVKLVGEPLRRRVLSILENYPEVKLIRIEGNQGGEHWNAILHDMPVPIEVHNSTDKKEDRLARAVHWYQAPGRRVLHHERQAEAEAQMIAYPNVAHDDIADAISLGVLFFLDKKGRIIRPGVRENYSYLDGE